MEQFIQQLQDPNPRRRIAAIAELAKTKDPRVLKPLWAVYQNDLHPEVRKAAYQAGRYVRKQNAQQSSSSWAAGATSEPPRQHEPQEVSARDKQRARSFLDRAVGYHMNQNEGRAAEFLARAVQTDLGLRKESVAVGLASELTRRPPEEAFDVLLNTSIVEEMSQQSRQRIVQERRVETAQDMSVATTYTIIYWVVSTVGVFILMLLWIQVFADNIAETLPTDDQAFIDSFETLSILGALIIAGVLGVSQTISMIFNTGTIHLVARFVFVGSGTFWGLLRRLAIFYTVVTGLMLGGYFVMIASADPQVFFGLIVLGTIGSFYSLYYLTRLVADHYNFGFFGGCLSIIGGGIVAAILSVIISAMLGLLVAAL